MNAIDARIKQLGLVETTTPKQAKNATREFLDPQTNTHYASYATGYVRRIHRYSRTYANMYPVNRRRKIENPKDRSEVSYSLERRQSDRMLVLLKAVETYRITSKVQILMLKFPELSNRCLRELAIKNYAYFSKDWEGKSTLESNASR